MIKIEETLAISIDINKALIALLVHLGAKVDLILEKMIVLELRQNFKDNITNEIINSEFEKINSEFISKQYELTANLVSNFSNAGEPIDVQKKINQILDQLGSLIPDIPKSIPKTEDLHSDKLNEC